MQFKEWIIQHQKKVSLLMGGVLMLLALGIMYWDNSGMEAVSEEEVYAQKVAAMEARMSGGAVSSPQNESPIMKAYKEKQAEHLRYSLIVMLIGGAGFMVYGLVKKKK